MVPPWMGCKQDVLPCSSPSPRLPSVQLACTFGSSQCSRGTWVTSWLILARECTTGALTTTAMHRRQGSVLKSRPSRVTTSGHGRLPGANSPTTCTPWLVSWRSQCFLWSWCAVTLLCLALWGCSPGALCSASSFTLGLIVRKSKLPAAVVALQDAGVLVSRGQHADHHRPPYNNNYCIVSGIWNDLLDRNKVFEVLEMVVYFKLGVKPRSWSDPNSAWTEDEDAEITI
ncbi:unnamed protein product [Linum tenue]|uniref:Lipid desaturase domain-containing protein n=3 Tax=Linum tenue TaxID=586396 RepID=A0AAV0H3W5_9ROSI|nr:unnamed protein product [Linum tenue]